MAVWNLVATEFNSLDETINFGTRAFAESDDCIYETSTQATIDPDGKVSEYPKVTTFSDQGNQFWVAVNQSMTAFSGEFSQSVLFTQVYDSNVSILSCMPDKSYLFVGLEKGTLLCIHSATSEKILSWNWSDLFCEEGNFVNIFYHKADIYVINSAGSICKISGIGCSGTDGSRILSSSAKPDVDIKCEKVASKCLIAPVRSVSCNSSSENIFLVAAGNGAAVWTEEYGWDHMLGGNEKLSLKKVNFLYNDPIALALNNSGELLQICTVSLTVGVVEIADKLTDFLITGAPGHERVVAITQAGDDKKATLLMLNVPGFDAKLRLKIGWPSQLISLGDEEDILFWEFLEENESISGLAIKSAVQTNPTIRLDRLLTRGKFDAALQLAQNFNLDPTRIYETKAKSVVESLQPWKFASGISSVESHRLYDELISLLDKIKNSDFISECCLNVISSEFEVSRNILQYAQKRISAFLLNNPEESKVTHLSNTICNALLKLETMALIEPIWDAEKWLEFYKRHPLDEVRRRLEQGQINQAVVVWNRHLSETQEILKDERFLPKVLDIIPRWVSIEELIVWLKQLLPSVMSKLVAGVPRLVEWIIPKVRALENVSGSLWPDIGLNYMKKLLLLFTTEHQKQRCSGMPDPAVREFAVWIDALSDLCELKKTYGVFIPLNDYREDDHEEVACTLLSKLDEKCLIDFLDGFLVKFVNQRHLDYDTVLTYYVQRILRHSLGWWMWDEAPWEKRILALLPKIGNEEMQLGCILSLLDEVPVPWSPCITKLVNDVATVNHPLAAKIRLKRKQIAVIMLAKKYNIKTAIRNINSSQLVRLIINRNLPCMTQDIDQLVNSTESKFFADLCTVCVLVFYENGKYDETRVYLFKVDDETAVNVCGALLEDSEVTENGDEDLLAKIGFHATIVLRLREAQSRGVNCASLIEDTWRRRNEMVLRLEFPFLDVPKEIQSQQDMLSASIKQLLRDEISESFTSRVKRFADLMFVPEEEALILAAELACKFGRMDLSVSASKMVVDSALITPAISFNLGNLACALLKKSQSAEKSLTNQSAVEVAYELSLQSIRHSPAYALLSSLDTFSWARTWKNLSEHETDNVIRSGDVFQFKKFSELYSDSELCGILNLSNISQSLLELFVQFESSKERDVSKVLHCLEDAIQQLQENQRDLAAFALICQIDSFFGGDCNFDIPVGKLLRKVVSTLVVKVVSSRYLDSTFAVSLLNYLGKDTALKVISGHMKSALLDLKKQNSLAKLGVTLSELWKDNGRLEEFRRVMVASSWGSRLPEYNISAKGLLYNEDVESVLKKLVCAPSVTMDAIKSFCDDYQCDFQAALSLHLINVLLLWDPDLVVHVQPDGKRVPVVRNTEEQLLERCRQIIQHAVDVAPIARKLKQIWLQINLYYHEIFLVVLQLLYELKSAIPDHFDKYLVLRFLKSYQRRKPADFDEENSWNDSFLSASSLPPLAEFRLPYSRLIYDSSRSVITPEITLQSYSTWLTVAAALEYDPDTMRVIAVRQSVSEEFGNHQNSNEAWCTSIKHNALYDAVKKCVEGMTNLMTASACLYFVVNKTPPGADQLKAAKLCLEYTERLTQNNEYADKLEKVQNKYLHLATTHVLYLCGLGDPQYLELVGSPEKLCYELHHHPAIVDYGLGKSAQCPNINGAVRKIGELHNIVTDSLQMDLIKDWLQSCCEANGDSSINENTFTAAFSTDNSNDNRDTENLIRALYVMEGGIKENWAMYLNGLISGAHAQTNSTVRLRALRCMLMLVDANTVEMLTGQDIAYFRALQRCLEYTRELESLGFACSEKSFMNCNKEELATVVLRTQPDAPRALTLSARLCLDYDVQQTTVWRTLLKLLTHRKMYDDLANILPSLTKLYHLWSTAEFVEAWTSLLITPFTQADDQPSEPQISAMLSAIEKLPNCPVLAKIDTRGAVDETLRIKRIELAVLLLPFCEKSNVSDITKEILNSTNIDLLEGELSRICSSSPINFKQAINYLRAFGDV